MKGWLVLLTCALVACDSPSTSTSDAEPSSDAPFDAGPGDARDAWVGEDAAVEPRSGLLPPVSGGTMAIADEQVVVADPDRDAIFVFRVPSPTTGVLERTIALDAGDEPGRVVISEGRALVVLRGAGELATIDLADGSVERQELCVNPRGLAAVGDVLYATCAGGSLITIDGDGTTRTLLEPDLRDVVVEGDRLYVSLFRRAEVLVVDRTTRTIIDRLVPGGEGQPNAAWRMRPAPEGGVLLLHQQSSQEAIEVVETGYGGGRGICGPQGIVQTVYSHLRMGEPPTTRLLPFGIVSVDFALSPDGSFSVANAGASELTRSGGVLRYQEPPDPADCFGLDFVVFEPVHSVEQHASGLLAWLPHTGTLRVITSSQTVETGAALLDDPGRDLFHAGTPAFVACATCHPEGRDDGVTWNFLPVGLRRTQSLVGGILDTAPFHWDGDQHDMDAIMTGSFTERMSGGPLASGQLEAISQWLDALPAVRRDATIDADTLRLGIDTFETVGCTTCHAGSASTDNRNVDVGTGGAFQVPSLRGVSMRAPFLHDGRASTLEEAVDQHADLGALTTAERGALLAYLGSL